MRSHGNILYRCEVFFSLKDFKEKKEDLILKYRRGGYVKDEKAITAFMQVPREKFIPEKLISSAYSDHPFPLMNTGQTISAPHMTIMILDYLELLPGQKILEIGSGSGYQAALIAAVVTFDEAPGHVYSIEIAAAPAEPDYRQIPSLLGRDILDQWKMIYHPLSTGIGEIF